MSSEDSTASNFFGGRPPATRLLAFWENGSTSCSLPARGTVTLGRSRSCDVQVDHPSISRQHLRLHLGADVRVEDLESANGTRLRGRTLVPNTPTVVARGEAIEAGSVVVLLQSSAAADAVDSAHARGGSLPESRIEVAAAKGVIIVDEAMKRLHHVIGLVARGDLPVLVRGESGVGKELVAAAVHQRSPRAGGPFVSVNCAALPETLLEAELFGHERGAFTGAVQARAGTLETADGGTLFLDEIGELSAAAQAKLLRVLERREIVRVGGRQPRPIDVRFVAATHRDLEGMVAAGTFRHDLFFRIDGLSIVVPPLRERPSEIEPLALAFIEASCHKLAKPSLPLSHGALDALLRHAWPGNVRELRHAVERAVLLAIGAEITANDLALATTAAAPPSVTSNAASTSLGAGTGTESSAGLHREIHDLERQRILDALEQCGGNQTRAAKKLGVSRRMLVNRLDDYAIRRPRKP